MKKRKNPKTGRKEIKRQMKSFYDYEGFKNAISSKASKEVIDDLWKEFKNLKYDGPLSEKFEFFMRNNLKIYI